MSARLMRRVEPIAKFGLRPRASSPAAPPFQQHSHERQFLRCYNAETLLARLPDASNPLLRTEIGEEVRTRMVDWMLEVLSKLGGAERLSAHTYFRAVLFADIYYKRCPEPLSDSDVHLIGLACMYTAAKYESDPAFTIEDFRDRAGGGLFTAAELRGQEFRLLAALAFVTSFTTVFDLFELYLARLRLPAAALPAARETAFFVLAVCARAAHLNSVDTRLVAAAALLLALRQNGAREAATRLLRDFAGEEEALARVVRVVGRQAQRFAAAPEPLSQLSALCAAAARQFGRRDK